MPQLHCYIPEEIAKKLRLKAGQAKLPVSKYLANLVKQDVGENWPDDFFEVFGSWKGEELKRSPQGEHESRERLD